jgi:DNA mismatch endonuclease (patch repair protein)
MARIRSRDTLPERVLRSALWRAGLRYRLSARVPGVRPDIVFPDKRVVVFIDGCFWHGCPEHYLRPRNRADFWAWKLVLNTSRDRDQSCQLGGLGWRVCRIWEHEVFENLGAVVRMVVEAVRDPVWEPRPRMRVVRVEPVEGDDTLERRYLQELAGSGVLLVKIQPRRATMWSRSKVLAKLREQRAVIPAQSKGRHGKSPTSG